MFIIRKIEISSKNITYVSFVQWIQYTFAIDADIIIQLFYVDEWDIHRMICSLEDLKNSMK